MKSQFCKIEKTHTHSKYKLIFKFLITNYQNLKKIKYLDETKIGILSHNETNDAPLISSVVFLYMTTKPEQTGDGHQWIEHIRHQVNLIAVVFNLYGFLGVLIMLNQHSGLWKIIWNLHFKIFNLIKEKNRGQKFSVYMKNWFVIVK